MPVNNSMKYQIMNVKEDISSLKGILEGIRNDRNALRCMANEALFSGYSPAFRSLKNEVIRMKQAALKREARLKEMVFEKELDIKKIKSEQLDLYQYALHIEHLQDMIEESANGPISNRNINKDKEYNIAHKLSMEEVFCWIADFYDLKAVTQNAIEHLEKLLNQIENAGLTHRQEELELNMNIIGRWLKKMGWLFFSREKEEQYKAKLTELQEVISQLRDELVHYKGTFEEVYDRLLEKEHSENEFRNSVKELNDIYRQFIEVENKYKAESVELNQMLTQYKEKDIKNEKMIRKLEIELQELKLNEQDLMNKIEFSEKAAEVKEAKTQRPSQVQKSKQLNRKIEKQRNHDFDRHGSLPIPPQSAATMFDPFKYSKKQ
ncbi:hypothetical protein LLY41_13575 [Cytobacillus firmus]|uniref:hypothetical protein n=1 Tax=Cytobacillus firmus TaxID=1399 RepID=UPI00218A43A9|nr:hypothetical protein [Cytobacillus firmus]URM31459.1 hypothetical protein LLY41_13575 [Cytobacillus firmus]